MNEFTLHISHNLICLDLCETPQKKKKNRILRTSGLLFGFFDTLQGSRLTAFELVNDKIPATLIADSAAASLMKARRVDAVVVGADRIAANGDQ